MLERPQCDNASTVSGIEFQSGLGGNRKFDNRWSPVVWQPYWNVFLLLATYVGNGIKGGRHRLSDVVGVQFLRHVNTLKSPVTMRCIALYNIYIYRYITSLGRYIF